MPPSPPSIASIQDEVIDCRRCPRLVRWRERVAEEKKRAYRDEDYWGRPVPAFGDHAPRVLILGLAPGAHGANRTGRQFTGDASGDWLFRALHATGFASQPTSVGRDDGMALSGCLITSPVRCAPPGNKPTTAEKNRCRSFLLRELKLLESTVRVVVCLGGISWSTYLRAVRVMGDSVPSPVPRFGHGVVIKQGLPHVLIGSYHPSRLNTQTGRLTDEMLQDVFNLARRQAGLT